MSLLAAQARTRERVAMQKRMAESEAAQKDIVKNTVGAFESTMLGVFKTMLASIPKPDFTPILSAIKAIPRVNLEPVLAAIRSIPKPDKVDLSPVLKAVEGIPQPKLDLTQVLGEVAALRGEIAELKRQVAAIDVSLPEIHIPESKQVAAVEKPPIEVEFDITYNPMGGIKSLKAREVR